MMNYNPVLPTGCLKAAFLFEKSTKPVAMRRK